MDMKILVVDDENDVEQLVRQKFRRQIREGEYDFVFAANGLEALEQITAYKDIDIVFSDINMPKMDGLTLLEKIGESNPLLKTVMISAYGDMDNIRTAMNRGAFDFICKPFNFEDFERTLQKALGASQQIKNTIQAIQENNILKMYVDSNVLKFMCYKEFETELTANEMIEASILFVDISGFTAISEHEPADKVINILNLCFDHIVKAIIAENGFIDKFMGDAVLAVFRDAGHLSKALRAALAINTAIQPIEIPLSNGQIFAPKVSIGVQTGEVIYGNVGSAALRRFDFTVIGDVVNTAQRLQSTAKPGQILVTRETFDKVASNFEGHDIGEFTLKNKQHPVRLVQVDGVK